MKTEWKSIRVHEETWHRLKVMATSEKKSIALLLQDLIAAEMRRRKQVKVPTE